MTESLQNKKENYKIVQKERGRGRETCLFFNSA